jgi:Flp pilus assembly protein TadD
MANEKLSPGVLPTKAKPKRAAIYARVSTDYMILGNYEKAAAVTRELLGLEPTNGQGYVNLGQIYLALNRFDEAR